MPVAINNTSAHAGPLPVAPSAASRRAGIPSLRAAEEAVPKATPLAERLDQVMSPDDLKRFLVLTHPFALPATGSRVDVQA